MVKPVEKLFRVTDKSSGGVLLVQAQTRAQAMNTAIGARFEVDVPTPLEVAGLIGSGAAIVKAAVEEAPTGEAAERADASA